MSSNQTAIKTVHLEDVCEFLDHLRKPISAKDRKSGPYPYYGANGVLDYVDDYIFDEELVLLAEDGGFFDNPERGVAYRISGKSWVNNHAHALRAKDNIDIDYLGFVLKQYNVRPFVSGAVVKKITQKAARKMAVPLPPLEDQKRIVKILDQADSLRQKRKQAIALLDEYVKSVFLEMFGDPVSNPKGWKKVSLGQLGKLDRGVSKHRPRNAPELLGGDHPLIQTGDVSKCDFYINKYHSSYSNIGLRQSKKWPKGTLCITIAANIAKTGILGFEACFPDSVVGFIPDDDKTNNEFIHYWFSFFQKILEESAPESAQKNINLKILRELKVALPPFELQADFCRSLRKIEFIKERMLQQSQELDTQFQALMQKAFKGEL